MLHARTDYDHIQDPNNKIPADEPVLLLRGQDPLAPEILEQYARETERMVGGDKLLANTIRIHAQRMRIWQSNMAVPHGPATMPEDAVQNS